MAEELENAEERKKTLTADVAHELRTPIAVQKAQLESMMDGVLPINEENLNVALQQADMLSRIVDDLRLLALADAGEIRLELHETDVRQLVEEVSAQFKLKLQQEGMKIHSQFTPQNGELFMITSELRPAHPKYYIICFPMRYGMEEKWPHPDCRLKKKIKIW
jgi:signal transduction histidine kinase